MDNKNKFIMSTLQRIMRIMMMGILVFFVLGEMLMPADNPSDDEECQMFVAEWERVMPDGTREPVEVPGECMAETAEPVIIETILPQHQEDEWFCIQSLQQDLRIYVGSELRKEYSTKDTRMFGRNSANAYVFFKITEEDAGKVLRIESISDSSYSGYLNSIYTGEKSEIWTMYIRFYLPGTMVAIFMLLLSIIVVCYTLLLRIFYKKKMEISYLGSALLMISVWLLAESKLRQLIVPNGSVATSVGFFVIMLLPYPFLAYMNRTQKRRYQNIYMILAVCTIINSILSTVLQILNIKDFFETMWISHAIIVMLMIIMIYTIISDARKGYIKEYPEVAIGIGGMILAGAMEIVLVYVKASIYNGIPLGSGLIFLFFMGALKTGRDMTNMEKEKQRALVASESKAKFLANMSHEIRTPINTVIGMNEMILRESQDENINEYAQNVQNASRMLLGLINDVLDLSKIEAGKLEIIENRYYLASMLNDVILGIKTRAENKKLEFVLDIDEKMPSILKGDEIRIKQVLNNLLSNAVKYTEKGSITFTAKSINNADGFSLVMAVKDTGIGIRKEDIKQLFDSFLRLELNKNRSIEGTGLGLSITKQLVEHMNGKIEVESEHGKGSCFTVWIPQQIIEKTPMGNLQSAHKRDSSTKKKTERILYSPQSSVLVVDDNKMNLNVIKALLKQTEIKLDFAESGTECIQICKNKKFDLILMDHMMPEPDGIQTLHLLRKDDESINRETTVIVLTANAIVGAAEEYTKEGFADYLSKPIDATKLERMLSKYLTPENDLSEEQTESDLKDTLEVMDAEIKDESVVIDRKSGLKYCNNDESFYNEMLELYQEQGRKYFDKLFQHFKERNWKEYAIIVHAIKSTSLTIGAKEFSEMAKNQELAAKKGDRELLEESWEGFIAEYKKILEYVDNEVSVSVKQPVTEVLKETQEDGSINKEKALVNLAEYMENIEEIMHDIDEFELDNAINIIDELSRLQIPQEQFAFLVSTKSLLEDFQYDEAMEKMKMLISSIRK